MTKRHQIVEKDDYCFISIELAGYTADEVDVSIDKEFFLDIRAENTSRGLTTERIQVPSMYDLTFAGCTMSNGLLELKVPMIEERRRKITVHAR